jgi:hypothetical protein
VDGGVATQDRAKADQEDNDEHTSDCSGHGNSSFGWRTLKSGWFLSSSHAAYWRTTAAVTIHNGLNCGQENISGQLDGNKGVQRKDSPDWGLEDL